MPSLATGSRTQLIYVAESSFGVLPASPTMVHVRYTDETLELMRASLESAEIRQDRQRSDYRLGVHKLQGDIGMELLYGDCDPFFEACLGGTWLAPITAAHNDVTVAAAGHTYTSAALVDFLAAGFQIGDKVTVAGFTTVGNNGVKTVTNVAQHVLTVSETLTDEASGDSVTFTAARSRLTEGVTKRSFSMESGLLDIGKFLPWQGVLIDSINLDVKPTAIAKVKIGLLGSDLGTPTSSTEANVTSPGTTNAPMDAFTGTIKEGGSDIAYATSIALDMKNNIELAEVIGNIHVYDYFPGRFTVSGKMTAFVPDTALLAKFQSETESSLVFSLQGVPTNRTLTFTLPRIKYTKASIPVSQERGLPIDISFEVLLDSVTGHTMMIDRSGL